MRPIDRPDPRYRWRYIIAAFTCGYVHKSMQKFKSMTRCGNPQSDWVGGTAWSSPVAIFVDEVCYE